MFIFTSYWYLYFYFYFRYFNNIDSLKRKCFRLTARDFWSHSWTHFVRRQMSLGAPATWRQWSGNNAPTVCFTNLRNTSALKVRSILLEHVRQKRHYLFKPFNTITFKFWLNFILESFRFLYVIFSRSESRCIWIGFICVGQWTKQRDNSDE
jgi:hypothetical protein